jgi:manganese/zinc/iron transport system permease protein
MIDTLRNIFVVPWQDAYTVFWPMLLQGGLVSCALGLLGCFLVVRGMSLLGDALSHAVLPGIVIGFLIADMFGAASLHSPWILIGAAAMGLLATILVEVVQRQSRVKEDASLGIVFTTLFAAGVILISRYAGQADLDPGCVLYGNIEYFASLNGSLPSGVIPMAVILCLIIIGIVAFYRPLLITTFDPGLAVSVGITAWMVHYGLMTALSLTIVASFEAVGAILAVALLILPGATARLWTNRLSSMLWFTIGYAIICTLVGYWLSHQNVLNSSAGATITATGFFLFVVSWMFSPEAGLLHRWHTRRRLQQKIALENLIKTIGESSDGAPELPAADVQTLADELRLTRPRLNKLIQQGMARGWLSRQDNRIGLTAAGAERQRRLSQLHVAWETYLQEHLNLPADHVHDAAEWIEHYLNETALPAAAANR